MARTISPGSGAAAQLVDTVGAGWGPTAGQALSALLRRVLPPGDPLALDEVPEAAQEALAVQPGSPSPGRARTARVEVVEARG